MLWLVNDVGQVHVCASLNSILVVFGTLGAVTVYVFDGSHVAEVESGWACANNGMPSLAMHLEYSLRSKAIVADQGIRETGEAREQAHVRVLAEALGISEVVQCPFAESEEDAQGNCHEGESGAVHREKLLLYGR